MCPLVNSRSLKPVLKSIQRHVCMHYPKVMEVTPWWPPLTGEAWEVVNALRPSHPSGRQSTRPLGGPAGLSASPSLPQPVSDWCAQRPPAPLSFPVHLSASWWAQFTSKVPAGLPWQLSSQESACSAGDIGRSLGQEDPWEEKMATHSSVLAREIPWTEEPGRLQSMGLDTT